MVLYDWQRGKIPFFTLPPGHSDQMPAAEEAPAEVEIPAGLVQAADVEALEGAQAAHAAEQVNEGLMGIMRRQVRQHIPIQQDYYTAVSSNQERVLFA